jgi:hypothetical protein
LFARTFAVNARSLDFANYVAVGDFLESKVKEGLQGRRPFDFRFFVDAAHEDKKLVFYDMSTTEHVIEFSGIFGRLPRYSVSCEGKAVKIYGFDDKDAEARILSLGITKAGIINSVERDVEETRKESASLLAVASATSGFLDTAMDLDGVVNCTVVESAETKERLPFFTLKIDAKSERNRGILRSCEYIHFAWSEDRSNMVLICRFKMLPPYALAFPIMGRYIEDSMKLYMTNRKAVGMVMYTDDVNDSFSVEKEKPTFEKTQDAE